MNPASSTTRERELFDELAGIYEYDAYMSREQAELRARNDIHYETSETIKTIFETLKETR